MSPADMPCHCSEFEAGSGKESGYPVPDDKGGRSGDHPATSHPQQRHGSRARRGGSRADGGHLARPACRLVVMREKIERGGEIWSRPSALRHVYHGGFTLWETPSIERHRMTSPHGSAHRRRHESSRPGSTWRGAWIPESARGGRVPARGCMCQETMLREDLCGRVSIE
jgi:hypothetical protein